MNAAMMLVGGWSASVHGFGSKTTMLSSCATTKRYDLVSSERVNTCYSVTSRSRTLPSGRVVHGVYRRSASNSAEHGLFGSTTRCAFGRLALMRSTSNFGERR